MSHIMAWVRYMVQSAVETQLEFLVPSHSLSVFCIVFSTLYSQRSGWTVLLCFACICALSVCLSVCIGMFRASQQRQQQPEEKELKNVVAQAKEKRKIQCLLFDRTAEAYQTHKYTCSRRRTISNKIFYTYDSCWKCARCGRQTHKHRSPNLVVWEWIHIHTCGCCDMDNIICSLPQHIERE